MDKVTICDHLFLKHTKSASLGGDNIGIGPTYFEWEYADAQSARFVTDSDIKHARGKGQVAWLLEPYSLHPENYDLAFSRREEFDAILVHSYPNVYQAIWYPFGGSWIKKERWGMHEKTKKVSILISEKNSMDGHRLRHEVVRLFGDEVDVFMGIPDKLEALAPYRYSIVIESEMAAGYFTEKLIDCMSVGTVPIYYGSPNVCFDFHPAGFIPVADIHGIKYALGRIGLDDYESRMDAIEKNIATCDKFRICEDNIFQMYPELF